MVHVPRPPRHVLGCPSDRPARIRFSDARPSVPAPAAPLGVACALLWSAGMTTGIKQIPLDDRPRERLDASGVSALSDQELIALLFGGDLPVAAEVVTRIGCAAELRAATKAMLREVPGVGPMRAAQLIAAVELGRRAANPPDRGRPISGALDVWVRVRDLVELDVEELHVLALDSRRRVLSRFSSARGESNLVHVSPRQVFRRALREGASCIIATHNHPSGNPIPSPDDVALTDRLLTAGRVVGLPLLDHVVVAAEGYFSFAEKKLLWNGENGSA